MVGESSTTSTFNAAIANLHCLPGEQVDETQAALVIMLTHHSAPAAGRQAMIQGRNC
jgi:hypothetical protein